MFLPHLPHLAEPISRPILVVDPHTNCPKHSFNPLEQLLQVVWGVKTNLGRLFPKTGTPPKRSGFSYDSTGASVQKFSQHPISGNRSIFAKITPYMASIRIPHTTQVRRMPEITLKVLISSVYGEIRCKRAEIVISGYKGGFKAFCT